MAVSRLVVLVSGSGTNLQALLDAIAAHPGGPEGFGAEVVAVGADREDIAGLERAEKAGIPTFVCPVKGYATREEWDAALTGATAAHEPDLVVSAGFMKIVGKAFIDRFGGRFINTHPALLPAFPGRTAYGTRSPTARRSPAAPSISWTAAWTPVRSSPRVWSRSGTGKTKPLSMSASRKSSAPCSSTSWGAWPGTATALRDER